MYLKIPLELVKDLLLISIFTLIFTASSSQAEPLRCGAILPLSGPMASIGVSIKNSMLMADADLDGDSKVEFSFEDGKFSPMETLLAARKLISVSAVKCIVVFGSSTSLAVVDSTQQAGVLTLSIAISPKVNQGRDKVFRIYAPVEALAGKLIEQIKAKGYKRIAILTTETDGALALRDLIRPQVKSSIVFDESVLPGESDLRTLLQKVVKSKPDAVFLNVLPPSLAIAGKQLRQLGVKVDLFSGPFLSNHNEVKAANGAFLGAWYVDALQPKETIYRESYRNRFGEDPDAEGIYGYEVARILINRSKERDLVEALSQAQEKDTFLGDYRIVNGSTDLSAGVFQVRE